MKNYSFYQYMKTRLGEASEIGALAHYIKSDASFPKYSKDYDTISDYLEKNPYDHISLSVFDDAFEAYREWLNF